MLIHPVSRARGLANDWVLSLLSSPSPQAFPLYDQGGTFALGALPLVSFAW
jgi:hypothetical protein